MLYSVVGGTVHKLQGTVCTGEVYLGYGTNTNTPLLYTVTSGTEWVDFCLYFLKRSDKDENLFYVFR